MFSLNLKSYGSEAFNKAKEYMPSPKTLAIATAVTAAVGGYFAANFSLSNLQPSRPEICIPHSFLGLFDVPFLYNCVSIEEIDRIFSLAKNVNSAAQPISQIANSVFNQTSTIVQNIANASECVDAVVNTTVSVAQTVIEHANITANQVFTQAASFFPESVIQVNTTLASKAEELSNGLVDRLYPTAITVLALALPYIAFTMRRKNNSVQTDSTHQATASNQSSNTNQNINTSHRPLSFRKKRGTRSESLRTKGAKFISDFATQNRFDLSPKPVANPAPKTSDKKPRGAKIHQSQFPDQERRTVDIILPAEPVEIKQPSILPKVVQKPSFVFRDATRDGRRTYAQVVDPSIRSREDALNFPNQTDSTHQATASNRSSNTNQNINTSHRLLGFRKKREARSESLRAKADKFISDFTTQNRFDPSPKPVANPAPKTSDKKPRGAKIHQSQFPDQERRTADIILSAEPVEIKQTSILPKVVQKPSFVFRDVAFDVCRTYAPVVDPSIRFGEDALDFPNNKSQSNRNVRGQNSGHEEYETKSMMRPIERMLSQTFSAIPFLRMYQRVLSKFHFSLVKDINTPIPHSSLTSALISNIRDKDLKRQDIALDSHLIGLSFLRKL